MYKIVLKDEALKIKSVEEVRDDKFYGLLTIRGKYLVIPNTIGCCTFSAQSWRVYENNFKMKHAIREYLLDGHEIFEFDTAEEILAWSIEKEIK